VIQKTLLPSLSENLFGIFFWRRVQGFSFSLSGVAGVGEAGIIFEISLFGLFISDSRRFLFMSRETFGPFHMQSPAPKTGQNTPKTPPGVPTHLINTSFCVDPVSI